MSDAESDSEPQAAAEAERSALAVALAQAVSPTGAGPEFRAAPSSGGLHPVAADGTALRTLHRVSAAKYGRGGTVAAETDLGAAFEIARVLLAPRGLRPIVTSVEDPGTGSVVHLAAEHCAVPADAERVAAAILSRRSRRDFAAPARSITPPSIDVVDSGTDSGARNHDAARLDLVAGPTHVAARLSLVRVGDQAHHAAPPAVADTPVRPADLVAACSGQDWVAGAAWAALLTVPGDLTRPAAWALGAAATRVHLTAHAAGLASCIVGALTPDAPRLWGTAPPGPGAHLAVIAGAPA